jgi:hypothetical protein
VVDAQASVEERKEEAEKKEQETMVNAINPSSEAVAAGEVAPVDQEEEARKQLETMRINKERLARPKMAHSEKYQRMCLLGYLKQNPLAWTEYGFNNKEELDTAYKEAKAAKEAEEAYRRRQQHFNPAPPRATGNGKRRGEG